MSNPDNPVDPATYDRPTAAQLYVHLENGEEPRPATGADLEKFGYGNRSNISDATRWRLTEILQNAGLLTGRQNLGDAALHPVWQFFDIMISDYLAAEEDDQAVINAEVALRAHAAAQAAADEQRARLTKEERASLADDIAYLVGCTTGTAAIAVDLGLINADQVRAKATEARVEAEATR
jgi:hypothetical protein